MLQYRCEDAPVIRCIICLAEIVTQSLPGSYVIRNLKTPNGKSGFGGMVGPLHCEDLGGMISGNPVATGIFLDGCPLLKLNIITTCGESKNYERVKTYLNCLSKT